jgi:hypothetical protein
VKLENIRSKERARACEDKEDLQNMGSLEKMECGGAKERRPARGGEGMSGVGQLGSRDGQATDRKVLRTTATRERWKGEKKTALKREEDNKTK